MKRVGLMVCMGVLCASAALALTVPEGLDVSQHGAAVTLNNRSVATWWYGCTPTSAGMLMGYYDRNGYAGDTYGNLVAGGVAEAQNNTGPLLNNAIASSGHIADFWTGYGNSGDDPLASGRTVPGQFDCLADFMGTSQDSVSSSDGSTWVYNFTDGSKFHDFDAVGYGVQDASGMYGITEYIDYAGYDTTTAYNQYIDTLGLTYGFSFADYMTEIDAGRGVLLHVVGHTMFGYGYDQATQSVLFHDTWDYNEHSMVWGTSYSGMDMKSVTALELVGGSNVPDGGLTLALLGSALAALASLRRRM